MKKSVKSCADSRSKICLYSCVDQCLFKANPYTDTYQFKLSISGQQKHIPPQAVPANGRTLPDEISESLRPKPFSCAPYRV